MGGQEDCAGPRPSCSAVEVAWGGRGSSDWHTRLHLETKAAVINARGSQVRWERRGGGAGRNVGCCAAWRLSVLETVVLFPGCTRADVSRGPGWLQGHPAWRLGVAVLTFM